MSLSPQRAQDRKLKQLHVSPRTAPCKGVISTAGSGSRVKQDYIALSASAESLMVHPGQTQQLFGSKQQSSPVPSASPQRSSKVACTLQVFMEIWHRPTPYFRALRELADTPITSSDQWIGSFPNFIHLFPYALARFDCFSSAPPRVVLGFSCPTSPSHTFFPFPFSPPFFCIPLERPQ